jgi:hypothetical protein
VEIGLKSQDFPGSNGFCGFCSCKMLQMTYSAYVVYWPKHINCRGQYVTIWSRKEMQQKDGTI